MRPCAAARSSAPRCAAAKACSGRFCASSTCAAPGACTAGWIPEPRCATCLVPPRAQWCHVRAGPRPYLGSGAVAQPHSGVRLRGAGQGHGVAWVGGARCLPLSNRRGACFPRPSTTLPAARIAAATASPLRAPSAPLAAATWPAASDTRSGRKVGHRARQHRRGTRPGEWWPTERQALDPACLHGPGQSGMAPVHGPTCASGRCSHASRCVTAARRADSVAGCAAPEAAGGEQARAARGARRQGPAERGGGQR